MSNKGPNEKRRNSLSFKREDFDTFLSQLPNSSPNVSSNENRFLFNTDIKILAQSLREDKEKSVDEKAVILYGFVNNYAKNINEVGLDDIDKQSVLDFCKSTQVLLHNYIKPEANKLQKAVEKYKEFDNLEYLKHSQFKPHKSK